ncbi:hypothetical protein M422DRAFT_33255 [Sphaerobolus stellatus SS14]|uniref:Uncharacterized protein n=1 Tax=Sphaerobolus stellatus (strain SS14) TaxID=990650 RepID=A0A0C9VAA7_SPHS4|nr:hypothetical protein M422DRAFT_33255 [Sphaerobolus stellatus SS14]
MSNSDETPPKSTLPYPPIHKDKKFVILTDWDGTITTYDSNDYMTDNLGFGKEKRRQGNLDILSGKVTFKDGFREMLESVPNKFDECKQILKDNIKLDEGFRAFYEWTKSADVPVIIVSSGMAPLIRAVLSNLVGEEDADKVEIISNDVKVNEDGRWKIQFRHPTSGYGHDKSQAILPYRELPDPPTLFFFGDGVSDLSAARHADVLFVKAAPGRESDLATYCDREGIPHILFESFEQVLPMVQAIVEGKMTKEEAIEKGKTF